MTRATIVDGRLMGATFLEDPRLQRVLAALDGAGEEARVVGGAVRNALLGEPVHEVDIATTATPDVIMARAQAAGLRTIPTGIDHGTITILCEGEPFEATTLREDVETHGRHATVRFGRDFAMDALRRDFTINALSVDGAGRLHDYTGGVDDAAARRVRFIGDAGTRIREDYLRILRFFRFHAAYGEGAMDRAAFDAVVALRAGLTGLSRERVLAELMKLMTARGAPDVVSQMSETGILIDVLAGVTTPARLAALAHIEAGHGLAADASLRFGALAVLVVEDADRLRARLRLSNAQHARLTAVAQALVGLHGATHPPDLGSQRALLFQHGRRAAMDAVLLAHAMSGAARDDREWSCAYDFVRDTPEPRLPFSGEDLLARGLSHGPGIGAVLKRLQAMWIRAGFPREPETLARLLDEAIASAPAQRR